MAPYPVLIVDDDAISRHVLCQALEQVGMPFVAVASGAEALARLEHQTPSLLLLDLVMPQPDGYEVLSVVRARPETRDLPVLVLTGLDGDSEITRAFEAGADDFVRKPFRAAELIARIRGQLRLRGATLAIEKKEKDAQLVLELTQALASNLDFRSILFTVTQRVAEVARVDRVSIVLVRESGDVGYVVAASDDAQLRDLAIDLSKYPEIKQVIASAQPLVITDAATHPLLEIVRQGDSHARAFSALAILPIVYEGKAMGVLFLRAKQSFSFGERELGVCRTISSAMAIALRNARVLQSLRDQTQQVTVARFEAERRLESLQRYADFFESSADGIAVFDADARLLFSNPKAREITGYDEADLNGRRISELLGDHHDAGRALQDGFARGEFPQGVDLRLLRKDGKPIVLSLSFSSVLREESVVLCSFRDVTAERSVASELIKTKDFLGRIIDASADAIICADLTGRVLIFNRAAERLYARTATETLGSDVRALYPVHGAARIMRLIRQGHGRVDGVRVDVLDSRGELVPVTVSAMLLYDGARPVGSVGVFTDLREKMRMEQQLESAQRQLIERERHAVIAELAGAAAHELNQPLTTVIMSADLLKRKLGAESPAIAVIEVLRNEADRMATIVKKIGKITRYETKSYVGRARILDLDKASEADADKPRHDAASVEHGSSPPRGD